MAARQVILFLVNSLVFVGCGAAPSAGDAATTDSGAAADVPGGDTGLDASESDATPDATRADASTVDSGPVVEPGPRWIGRHDASDPSMVRMSWSGTGMVLRFQGTAARVTMNDAGQYYTVVVDGEVQETLAVSGDSQTYTLASDLADAEHVVELYRRTEGFFGVTRISSVEVDGEMLPVSPPERLIEVVGDSITAGYGVDGADRNCSFSAETENHFLTWGAIAARTLGAELSAVAWSGKGVVHNFGDDREQPMPTLYDRTIATEAGSEGGVRPADVVVINLGTNDYSTSGDPSEDEFVPEYVRLLEEVRVFHPDALIACTVGPPLGNADMARARSAIDAAMAIRREAGDAQLRWVDLDGFSDWGCDSHPGDETQALLAEDLVTFLRAELGW
ncbi:MAG: SGNH/GDSL hydrolase family protein [Polyangiales bacterium]